ncbi:MAG TPA: HAD family phosphatase [Ktedonobacterales bacterium]
MADDFPHIKLVIFDFDGLMVNSEHVVYAALREIFASHGQNLTWDFYCTTIGLPSPVAARMYLGHLPIPLSEEELVEAERVSARELMATELLLLPGLLPLLEDLRVRGIPSVICSSSRRSYILPILERFGIAEYFAAVVSIDDVARGKPHPDLVHKALEVAHVASGQAVMLEDSAHGVEAAHAAGVYVIAVPTPGIDLARFERADAVVQDLVAAHALVTERLG